MAWLERGAAVPQTGAPGGGGAAEGRLHIGRRRSQCGRFHRLLAERPEPPQGRAGQSLELHLEALFSAHGIRFARGAETENRNKPDFLFPGAAEYHDETFPVARLTMLGAKSTLKDRWRQVLSEARRIEHKHLVTLEPGISEAQTNQMQAEKLQWCAGTDSRDLSRRAADMAYAGDRLC